MTLNGDDLNYLFEQLEIIFPASGLALTDQKKLNAMKNIWYQALCDEKITIDNLKLGVRRATKAKTNFFPSIGVFIDWCRPDPSDLNIPSPDAAYREATKNAQSDGRSIIWSHPLVEYAAKRSGYHELSRQTEAVSRPRFEKYYNEAIKNFITGKPMVNYETHRLSSPDQGQIPKNDLWTKINYYTPDSNGIRPCDYEKPKEKMRGLEEQQVYGEIRMEDLLKRMNVKRMPIDE